MFGAGAPRRGRRPPRRPPPLSRRPRTWLTSRTGRRRRLACPAVRGGSGGPSCSAVSRVCPCASWFPRGPFPPPTTYSPVHRRALADRDSYSGSPPGVRGWASSPRWPCCTPAVRGYRNNPASILGGAIRRNVLPTRRVPVPRVCRLTGSPSSHFDTPPGSGRSGGREDRDRGAVSARCSLAGAPALNRPRVPFVLRQCLRSPSAAMGPWPGGPQSPAAVARPGLPGSSAGWGWKGRSGWASAMNWTRIADPAAPQDAASSWSRSTTRASAQHRGRLRESMTSSNPARPGHVLTQTLAPDEVMTVSGDARRGRA